MGRIGWGEMLLILLVVLILFGSTRLPALGKSLGEGIKNLKKGLSSDDDDGAAKEDKDKPA
jgi:sec-independent protein translocase protein TatA